jgi:sugar/nucleoside kinase (ribokinase family)
MDSQELLDQLAQAIPPNALRAADSQVSNRWGNILDFTDFDLIAPNERETRFALGDQDSVVRPLAQTLYNKARCKYLILKLGARGILSLGPDEFFIVDSFVQNLVDPIGAGDALLAISALSLAQSGSIVMASILGSLAAAVAGESLGNLPIQIDDVERRINSIQRSVSA